MSFKQGTATRKPIMGFVQIASWVIILSFMLVSCGDRTDDPRSIYRPKFFRENTSIPFLDEHNLISVQLVEVDNPFPQATRKRVYALWFNLDGRGRFALHAETGDYRGKNIHMFISGQSIGYHPIQIPLDNGVLPILLPPQMQEADARFLQKQLQRTIAKVQSKRGK